MSLEHSHAILDAFTGVLDEETAREVIDYRKRMGKRYALTPRSAGMLAKNLARCPDPVAAAEEMIVRGWQSIKPEWIQKTTRTSYADAARSLAYGAESLFGDSRPLQQLPAVERRH